MKPEFTAKKNSTGETIVLALPIPRSALTMTAAPPELLSQRNVEAAVGIPARIYLELLRAPDFPLEVVRLGKLRLVDRSGFVIWLTRRKQEVAAAAAAGGIDKLAAELGLRRVGGRG